MRLFNFCPKCKSKNIEFKNKNNLSCKDCNFNYFHNVAGAVSVIIKKGDKYLFVKRNKDPKKGMLDMPGGFIDPEESGEQAVFRELKEELFIQIDKSKLSYVYSRPNTYLYKDILYNVIDIFYEYKDENIVIDDFDREELDGFIWLKLQELNLEEMAFDSQKEIMKIYQQVSF